MFNLSLGNTNSDTITELDRKFKNPFWIGFFIAWITWNWRVWYLTIFISEELIGNKIIAIQAMYTYFGDGGTYPGIVTFPGIVLHWILIPICISGIVTFLAPKITDEFLKQHKINKENEDEILRSTINSEKELAIQNTKLLKAQTEEYEALKEKQKAEIEAENEKWKNQIEIETRKKAYEWAQAEIEKSKNTTESGNIIWDKEYTKLIGKFPDFWQKLTHLIYEDKGDSEIQDGDQFYHSNKYDAGEIQLLDVNGLIELNENSNRFYHITEKGKYFLQKHSLS